jgi:methanogenic corrinoid protein MtbC1
VRAIGTACLDDREFRDLHLMVTLTPPSSDSPAELSQRLADDPLMSIAAVERATGLSKDTLRAWERRYGFPMPQRDRAGFRGYPPSLVDRLVLIRRALLAGKRPGRLLALPAAELDAVLAGLGTASAPHPPADAASIESPAALEVDAGIAALRSGGAEALRHWLTLGLARTGLAAFVIDGIAPLTVAVGEGWLDGSVAVHEEHLYSEAVQSVLRSALLPFQTGLAATGPRMLLTTVPGEAHGLGLLMAEALMTLEACRCVSLGVQTPVADIAAAAAAHRSDVVALSFSESLTAAQALPALCELRASLPATVAIWAGGASPALRGLRVSGIRVMSRLADIGQAVAEWRQEGSPPAN